MEVKSLKHRIQIMCDIDIMVGAPIASITKPDCFEIILSRFVTNFLCCSGLVKRVKLMPYHSIKLSAESRVNSAEARIIRISMQESKRNEIHEERVIDLNPFGTDSRHVIPL